MFAPRSAALVGATDSTTSFGGRVFRQMTGFGFAGKIYPVNPRLKEIGGLKCYREPEGPARDARPRRHHRLDRARVRRARRLRRDAACRSSRVFSAGFSETGTPEGRERQAKLLAFVRAVGHAPHGSELQRRHQLRRRLRDDVDRGDHGAARGRRATSASSARAGASARSTSCGARRRSASASATKRAPATKRISTRSISRASCCARRRPTSC